MPMEGYATFGFSSDDAKKDLDHKMSNLVIGQVQLPLDRKLMSPLIVDSIEAGTYEAKEARILNSLLCAAETVLELGSGLGVISTICGMNPQIKKVVTVEANPRLADYIGTVHRINGVSDKVTRMTGVAMPKPAADAIPFYLRQDMWASSMDAQPWGYQECIMVPTLNLNELIAEHKPELLVVDIEGGEQYLFQDIELGSVKLVMMELHQGVVGRKGLKVIFDALSVRDFHYEQWHSQFEIVTFSRTDRS